MSKYSDQAKHHEEMADVFADDAMHDFNEGNPERARQKLRFADDRRARAAEARNRGR